ncbi:hypothetical protein SDC9_107569 [bioreactor metagenome]|uniref:Methyltransferase domain-containing protein n=1 Tax=bioreactor metagenome TaxID=1076179 RepID=A0A645B5P4_9ZZZZ
MEEFVWTDAHIRWMSDSSKKSRFYYQIAERISAYLPPTARIFNAGGGVGDLAIWLSYHVEQVTVIDNDPKAVAAFRAQCPQNVVAILGDVLSYSPDKLYDALVLCDIGGAEQIMPVVREISRAKTFILLSRDKADGEAAIAQLSDMLKTAQIPFSYFPFEQDHIQPLQSLRDAREYLLFAEGREVPAAELESCLEKTGESELPFLYRTNRKIGMIVFDAANPALKKPLA